jgi:hypothetical protein
MWKRVSDAKEEVNSIRDYLAKFEDLSVRRRIGKAGQMYFNAIDKILEDVDLKKVRTRNSGGARPWSRTSRRWRKRAGPSPSRTNSARKPGSRTSSR